MCQLFLLGDGELIAAVEEEWFRRVKHWAGVPREAIRRCLEMARVAPKEVDHFAVSRNPPRANLLRKALFTLRNRPSPMPVWDRVTNSNRFRDVAGTIAEVLGLDPKRVRERMHWVEHHPAHVGRTFFVSPFEEAAVCAVDGFGDLVSTSLAIGRGRALEILERVCFHPTPGGWSIWPPPSIGDFPNQI